MNTLTARYAAFVQKIQEIISPVDGVIFFVRCYIANIFYASAKTKMAGFLELNDFTVDLFYNEYGFPLFSYNCAEVADEWGEVYDECSEIFSAETAAHLAMYAEVFFPLMLMLGVFTRFGAAGLMAMTLFIQFYVYPAQFHEHIVWFAGLFLIVTAGPGKVSLDHALGRILKSR